MRRITSIMAIVAGSVSAVHGQEARVEDPLMNAVKSRDVGRVQSVLATGSHKVSRSEHHFRSPLELAASTGDEPVFFMLLGAAAVNREPIHDIQGLTATACYAGSIPMVKTLLALGARVSPEDPEVDVAPLNAAATAGHRELCEFLLRAGAPINAQPTALAVAAARGHIETVRFLLDRGADPNLGRVTPLTGAARSGQLECMQLLLERGARLDGTSESWPLRDAVLPESVDAMKLLLEYGAKWDAWRDQPGPVYLAAQQGKAQTLLYALRHGAPANDVCYDGTTALSIACRTPSADHTATIRVLLGWGADVNAANQDGVTALMNAAGWCDATTVELLLKAGAQSDVVDSKGKTAADYAKDNPGDGREEILRALRRRAP